MPLRQIKKKVASLAALLIKCKLVSPRLLGYRHLPSVSITEYCEAHSLPLSVHCQEQIVTCPLPTNIACRDLLNRDPGRYERSFYEVPDFHVTASYSATLPNCRILRSRNKWGDDFYAIVTETNEILQATGNQFRAEHAKILRQYKPSRSIEQVSWVTTHSTRNHYMWLYTHLPRVLLAEKLGLAEHILFPAKDLLSNVKLAMLSKLGYTSPTHFIPDEFIIHVDKLTLLDIDSFDPWALSTLRNRMVAQSPTSSGKRIYVSREKCHYRKLANEAEIWPTLAAEGFQKVFLEDMTLDEQIETLSTAEIVLGAHGAGFANILFCRPGTRVIEIQDPDDPNPHFYALASLLDLDYSLIVADVDSSQESHYRDLTVKPPNLLQEIRRERRQ